MASLFELNADSSDSEDDCDYVPENVDELSDVSEDEGRFSGEESPIKRKKKVRKPRKKIEDSKFHESEVDDSKVDSAHESPNSPIVEKKRAEEVWNSFLKEVGENKKENKPSEFEGTGVSVVKSSDSSGNKVGKTTAVTEVYDFAGETVTITKEVNDDGKSVVKSEESATCVDSGKKDGIHNQASVNVNKRRAGIESVIGSIVNKKGKMTTLQKSLLDWKTFKKEEGLEEDLEQYNRGRGGYLEKQKFLQRSDLRRFELEKNARLSKYRKK